jgi:hypothetical protein
VRRWPPLVEAHTLPVRFYGMNQTATIKNDEAQVVPFATRGAEQVSKMSKFKAPTALAPTHPRVSVHFLAGPPHAHQVHRRRRKGAGGERSVHAALDR